MKYILLAVVFLLLISGDADAYGVLTHEAIIDINWEPVIVPLLKQRYPAASAKDLEDAHAYAYGGAIAPDMGYYPFGNRLFSDLIHYVRNGAFIITLQEGAASVQEYAFALGVLSHYNADKFGHSMGVNLAVPLLFPKLRAKYGPVVTYEENPVKHIRTEFGFDVLQTARGNYAPDAYQRFISFKIADDLLKRAFKKNYDLDIDSIFSNFPRSVRTFRWAVKDVFPQLTKYAWKAKRAEIRKQQQTATERSFHYQMRRSMFYSFYGRELQHEKLTAQITAFILHISPKIGPLRPLRVVIPTPEAEKLFVRSFDTVSAHYRQAISRLKAGRPLPDIDFDTGNPSTQGEYRLADKTYYTLLIKLQERHYAQLGSGLKNDILRFYEQQGNVKTALQDPDQLRKTKDALTTLKQAATSSN